MNRTNVTNGTSALAASMAWLYQNETEFTILFGIGLLALFTNPLIMWTIWRQKPLHTGCFFIIAQLALADFIVGAAFTGTMIKRFIRIEGYLGEIISQLQCAFEMAPNYFSESASLSLALALGCERLLAAAMPIKFMAHQWKIAYAASVVAWTIPILDCSTMLIVMNLSPSKMVNFCTSAMAVTKGGV
uniref:G-protein coupled receptors family 1 profile domain-containing protein n=1 Tax=Plectus sambesii TaxID=2011161 RepID=A0A914X9K0_9BILA